MTELLPCPFCGGEAEMLTAESMHGGYLFGIMCNDCRSRGDVYGTEAEAIAAWNTRAKRTCTLTAEQVMAIAGKHQPDYCSDTHVCFDWQAIADELNTRAERTCERVAEYAKSPIDGKTIVLHRCSACHELMRPHMAYCPNCGAKAVKR